jgi:hypothetical protein
MKGYTIIEDIYVVKYSGGTLTVTPSQVVIERGRNRVIIPMDSITATHYTRNPGVWFVILCCFLPFLLPLLWLPNGVLRIDYQGRGPIGSRVAFNRFQQSDIEEAEDRIRYYADDSYIDGKGEE